jgi:hypothetical protein
MPIGLKMDIMNEYNCIDMIKWMIYRIAEDKIESFGLPMITYPSGHISRNYEKQISQAVRFDFRSCNRGAISLLLHAANPNTHYIGVYSIDVPVRRVGGDFPAMTSDQWKFRSDHDCSVMDSIETFLREHDEGIKSWDYIYPWKIVQLTNEEQQAMKELRRDKYRTR